MPDVIGLVREPNIICSSTTPTVPWGVNAAAEQLPMIVLNHGASFAVAEDVELVRERVHPATMAAEGPLHELGAIAIVNSDSQGMGRMMETVRRTFQLATSCGDLGRDAVGDDRRHERVLRYLAKVTIEPAITHGIADHVGSLQPGRLADIVLWEPAFFGVKPALVLKSAWPPGRRSVRATPRSRAPSRRAIDRTGAGSGRGRSVAVGRRSCRRRADRARAELRRHGRGLDRGPRHARPDPRVAALEIEASPRSTSTSVTGAVTLDGRLLAVDAVREVPLSRRYLLR